MDQPAHLGCQFRQDLQILISSIEDDIVGTRLSEKYNLPWFDVPQFVFGNIQSLLDKQIPEARRGKALELLQRYTGVYPGSTSVFEQAKARYEEKLATPGLLGPGDMFGEMSLLTGAARSAWVFMKISINVWVRPRAITSSPLPRTTC